MKFAAHTNATGDYSVEEALDLFAALGFDGTDVGCNEHARITIETPLSRRREIASHARDSGLVISALACYAGQKAGFTSLDAEVRRTEVTGTWHVSRS